MQGFRGCLFVAGYALCLLLLNVIGLGVVRCRVFSLRKGAQIDRVPMKISPYTQFSIDLPPFSR